MLLKLKKVYNFNVYALFHIKHSIVVMIKIHKNDSIVDIIIKIKDNNEKDIVLEFPF
jgi:hypothetical protein